MTHDLALVDAIETVAFAAVSAVLRSDSDLRRVGLVVRSWDGSAVDLAPPSLSKLPWLRLTPMPGESAWESEGQHRSDLVVQVEMAVEGTRAANLLNLWGAVRSALFPSDPTRRQEVTTAFEAAGIVQGTLTQAAIRVKPIEDNQHALFAAGKLTLTILVTT